MATQTKGVDVEKSKDPNQMLKDWEKGKTMLESKNDKPRDFEDINRELREAQRDKSLRKLQHWFPEWLRVKPQEEKPTQQA